MQDIADRIEKALDGIRPFLQADGGDVEVVEINGDELRIRLLGACSSCDISHMTMKAGIEDSVIKAVPEIKEVKAVK